MFLKHQFKNASEPIREQEKHVNQEPMPNYTAIQAFLLSPKTFSSMYHALSVILKQTCGVSHTTFDAITIARCDCQQATSMGKTPRPEKIITHTEWPVIFTVCLAF